MILEAKNRKKQQFEQQLRFLNINDWIPSNISFGNQISRPCYVSSFAITKWNGKQCKLKCKFWLVLYDTKTFGFVLFFEKKKKMRYQIAKIKYKGNNSQQLWTQISIKWQYIGDAYCLYYMHVKLCNPMCKTTKHFFSFRKYNL